MNEDLLVLVEEEKRKKRMLDIPFYIAGAVILLMILTFLILQPQPAGNRITYWIISITGFAAILIILRFVLHYVFRKRIKNLEIQALIKYYGNSEEEKSLHSLSFKRIETMFEKIRILDDVNKIN